jgi:cell division control protein 24
MEESFSVYEPYCANYYSAQDLVVQETPRLSKLADVLDPVYQLPSLLIKPVQRICKYPLLVNELVKSTDKNWAYSQELMDGLAAIKRVAEKVNETRRQFENLQAVEELKKRLDDGKELAWKDYGSLMLQDKVPVSIDDDNERDLHVFLFENVLLFCKEPKSSTILPKSNTLSINKKKRRGSLVPKFNIQTNLIADAAGHSQDGIWNLKIDIDHREMRQLSLKLRNEEQVKMWQSGLIKAKNLANETLTLSGSTLIADDDEDFCDDEEDVYFDIRSRRSNSFANHLPGRAKMTPSQSTDTIGWKHNSNGRPFQTVPGMNLSPLPRSSNSSVTSTNNYGYYPVSPPPSHPSSPTTHAMRTSNSNSSNWHRHDSKNGFNDLATKLLSDDEYLSYNVGRSHSHSAAVDIATKINPNRPFIPTPNRLRSQSNPNNMRNGIDYTTLTSSSAMLTAPKIQKPKPLDLSRGPPTPPSIRPVNSSPRLKDPPTTPGCVKVKLNFSDGIYVIVAPQDVSFFELMDRVEKKIRLVSNLNPGDLLRLKYQDEDSDLITINSDDDVQMAFESRGAYSTVNLFVSV